MYQSTPGEEDLAALTEIERVYEEFDRIDAGYGKLPVLPGSDLDLDNKRIPDWPVANLAPDLVGVAIDHMHTLRLLSGQQPEGYAVWPAQASWTLLRAALESASQATWMVCENDQDVRMERYLRVWYDDRHNQFKADALTYRERHRKKLPQFKDWDRNEFTPRVTPWESNHLRADFNFSECISIAAEFTGAGPPDKVVLFWKLASGYAHGRPWAWQVSSRFKDADPDSGYVGSHKSADPLPLAKMIGLVVLTIDYAGWIVKERMGHQVDHRPFMKIGWPAPNKLPPSA